jgi:hypothetical protein
MHSDVTRRAVKREVRLIAIREIAHHQVSDGSVDKPRLYAAIGTRFRTAHSEMAEWWKNTAIDDLVEQECSALVRNKKSTFSVGPLSGKYRTYVQIPNDEDGNSFTLKPRMEVTLAEARAMERFHRGKERAHAKERRFWDEVVTRAGNTGLRDDDPIRRIPGLREEQTGT